MARINSPVGEGQRNLYGDVRTIQTLLNKNSVVTTPGHLLAEDGKIGPNTIARIRLFQEKVVRMRNPDGVIDPNGVTMRNLTLHANFHTTVNRTTRVPGITQEPGTENPLPRFTLTPPPGWLLRARRNR